MPTVGDEGIKPSFQPYARNARFYTRLTQATYATQFKENRLQRMQLKV